MKPFSFVADTSAAYSTTDGWTVMLIALTIIFIIILLISLPVLVPSALIRRRVDKVMRQNASTIIPQYEAPLGLKPAEVGMLYDLRCDTLELQATLFDLHRRQIITLTDARAGIVSSQQEYDALPEFEKIAINAANTAGSVKKMTRDTGITILTEGTAQAIPLTLPPATSIAAFRRAVRSSLRQKGYPVKSFALTLFLRSLVVALLFGMWPILFWGSPFNLNGREIAPWSIETLPHVGMMIFLFGLIFFPFYLAVGYALCGLWAKLAGRVWLSNRKTRSVWPLLEGHRRYLHSVELDRLQFESIDQYNDPIAAALPYAMVYNLNTKWRERFKQNKA